MLKDEILKEYLNNRVQWMMQHNCTTDKDVLFKMMELYHIKKVEEMSKQNKPNAEREEV